eukprot:CAMPEP_0113674864 /NCGR_PEP_ID=MMETSP0038_2-20120614/7680_1 /TAXON_ID=2898 /ORGANISM="Cryptomonas paramecium" /LENGTH=873 /DNA_ID=CAMNT_0000591541 /DNA_START=526 /DNA_END=3144 /DNA_ORIENTATION=- /assembly_acc=CAM_ASM_000170
MIEHEDEKWLKACPTSEEAPAAILEYQASLVGFVMPKHIEKLPSWVYNQFFGLEVLDFSGVPGDREAAAPGHAEEAAAAFQAGAHRVLEAVVPAARDLRAGWGGDGPLSPLGEQERELQQQLNIFLIGDGESGKTSVVKALNSDEGRADYIRTDHRTVGVDVTTWQPNPNMNFKIYDLAGQEIYSKTHQLVFLRRAVYLFVWRARVWQGRQLSACVLTWLNALNNRIPGAYLVFVVTHIDQVDSGLLDALCGEVKDTVEQWNEPKPAANGAPAASTLRPKILGQGESVRVNCLSGDGIQRLKESIVAFAESMPWYREPIPFSWMKLQTTLERFGKFIKFLPLSKYKNLVDDCGVEREMLKSATSFFHDTGVIRFFGHDLDCPDSSDALASTVYTSTVWIIDVLKGIICHDRQCLMDYFIKNQDRVMIRHLSQMNVTGKVNRRLIPFLWPSQPASKPFWDHFRSSDRRGRDLWPEDIVSGPGDLDSAIALLEGFDLLVWQGDSCLVPGVLMPTKFPMNPALDADGCPCCTHFEYAMLPPGAFERLVTSIAKRNPCYTECKSFHASFHLEDGRFCQAFTYRNSSGGVQSDSLIIRSDSREILQEAEQVLQKIEGFFEGITRLSRTDRSKESRDKKPSSSQPNNILWAGDVGKQSSNEVDCSHCIRTQRTDRHAFQKSKLVSQWCELLAEPGKEVPSVKCPACEWEHRLLDILTTCRIPELRPCPCCKGAGHENRFSFNAGECRLQLDYERMNQAAAVTCFGCMAAGRPGQIRIADIAPEEAFVSGLCSVEVSAREAVMSALVLVEQFSDVLFFKREDGVRNPGKLRNTFAVVVLLSDAYLRSSLCKEEFLAAVRSGQLIIPILMPDEGGRGPGGD